MLRTSVKIFITSLSRTGNVTNHLIMGAVIQRKKGKGAGRESKDIADRGASISSGQKAKTAQNKCKVFLEQGL